MKRKWTSERGAALITVMLAITLLTVIVVEFAYSTQIYDRYKQPISRIRASILPLSS
jgi:type II secretory pathway component PulK